ncbi:Fur family transcriptional regulator [Fulvivirga sediminis]|uniref:Fur family transcriptional regulator n=1 Tax=Fulvivirga sediminis TaxID=2803949 RepID=UPI001F2DC360|nr:transcriptional repressor [Fulvivirga sediminis]
MNKYADIQAKISDSGLKVTHQRTVILEAVHNMNSHPSVEQIYDYVKESCPSISLGTVYKTAETFVEKGLIAKVSTHEGHMRYDPKLDNHGHIYCTNTAEIVDYYDEELNEVIINFFKKKKVSNLKIKNITLQINGDKIDPDKEISIK